MNNGTLELHTNYNIIPIPKFQSFWSNRLFGNIDIGRYINHKCDPLHLVVRHRNKNAENCETLFMCTKKIVILQYKLTNIEVRCKKYLHGHTHTSPNDRFGGRKTWSRYLSQIMNHNWIGHFKTDWSHRVYKNNSAEITFVWLIHMLQIKISDYI